MGIELVEAPTEGAALGPLVLTWVQHKVSRSTDRLPRRSVVGTRIRAPAWSIYGAQRTQRVATGRRWDRAEGDLVRRGSAVRVRQRALQKRRKRRFSVQSHLLG